MSQLLQNAKQTFWDANGNPLAGGSVGIYQPGTMTPVNTYEDQALTILNANPITLDASGRALIWGPSNTSYRQIVQDSSGNTIWDQVTSTDLSNPMTTPGDLIVGGTAGAPSRVGLGPSGYYLQSSGGTVTWSNPNPLTALGDIYVGGASGVPSRLPIGPNGATLQVVSGALTWISPSAAVSYYTFTPQATPTLTNGITWTDSTQQQLESYQNGLKGWYPQIVYVGTGLQVLTLSNSTTFSSFFPSSNIGTRTLPANYLIPGKTIKITLAGYVTAAPGLYPGPQLFIVPWIGGTALCSGTTSKANIGIVHTGFTWKLQVAITCTASGATGSVISTTYGGVVGPYGTSTGSTVGWSDSNNGTATTINTTIANLLDVKIASAQTCTLTTTSAIIEVIG